MEADLVVKRNYYFPDDRMLEQSQVMLAMFESDKAAFTALYPYLADPFAAEWQQAIDSAHALPLARAETANQKVATENMKNKMAEARDFFGRFASYVRLLFPDSEASQGIFGLDDFRAVRFSAPRLSELLHFAYEQANDAAYKADLIALGFTAADIAKLDTLSAELYSLYLEQDEIRTWNRVLTEERVKAYNKVWDFSRKVAYASKQVFEWEYAKLQTYMLYPARKKSEKPS